MTAQAAHTARPTIGFVGLGRMGANMARHLNDCGYPIGGLYDIKRETADALAKEIGGTAVRKLEAVTASADIIITVVSNDAAMKRIFTGKRDSLLIDAEDKIFINCATVSPQIHIDIEKLAKKAQAQALEGCMASSIPQARDGTLYLMIGGRKEAFLAVRPLLEDLSKDLIYVGKAGRAAEVKALVNMVMNINTAALAEGLGLAKALGLDLEMLCRVFSQTGANSRVLETDAEDMITRDHECYFSAEHAAKDSGIALKLAKDKKLKLPLAAATKAQYDLMTEAGLG
ncbi:MAG: NAD(P)-dependent oxidoreductase, partial [Verrucomicrobiota bacterium]